MVIELADCYDGTELADVERKLRDVDGVKDVGLDRTRNIAQLLLDTQRISLGYNLPEPGASWACGQLSAIPYLGQVLFTPTGGLGFTAICRARARRSG